MTLASWPAGFSLLTLDSLVSNPSINSNNFTVRPIQKHACWRVLRSGYAHVRLHGTLMS